MRLLVLTCGLSIASLFLCANTESVGQTSPTQIPSEHDKAAPAQNGKEEPSAASNPRGGGNPVLVNGRLDVPGAPGDSQTVPAKFSPRNDAFDKLPIMAAATSQFTKEQKSRIAAALRNAAPPVAGFDGKPTEEVPSVIELSDIPGAVKNAIPGLRGLKYVRSRTGILLVDPTNSVVVGRIASDTR
jgi:hypothetical protein